MGKLTITGIAKKEFTYDQIEITVRFQVHRSNTATALNTVMEQCEEFLSIMNNDGISMNDIRIGEDSVEQEYEDKELDVCATREINIRLPFDMEFTNHIMSVVQEKKYDADVDTKYRLSNEQEIHNELINQAIEDSKNKANMISAAMNQKVVGIDSVDIGRRYNGHMDWMCCEQERGITPVSKMKFSNQLKAPVTTEDEEVEVVWLIE